jgi:hypothetical protein
MIGKFQYLLCGLIIWNFSYSQELELLESDSLIFLEIKDFAYVSMLQYQYKIDSNLYLSDSTYDVLEYEGVMSRDSMRYQFDIDSLYLSVEFVPFDLENDSILIDSTGVITELLGKMVYMDYVADTPLVILENIKIVSGQKEIGVPMKGVANLCDPMVISECGGFVRVYLSKTGDRIYVHLYGRNGGYEAILLLNRTGYIGSMILSLD